MLTASKILIEIVLTVFQTMSQSLTNNTRQVLVKVWRLSSVSTDRTDTQISRTFTSDQDAYIVKIWISQVLLGWNKSGHTNLYYFVVLDGEPRLLECEQTLDRLGYGADRGNCVLNIGIRPNLRSDAKCPCACTLLRTKQCFICFSDLTPENECRLDPCRHVVCADCFENMIKSVDQTVKIACPICHADIKSAWMSKINWPIYDFDKTGSTETRALKTTVTSC